jgi:hypothetical protein
MAIHIFLFQPAATLQAFGQRLYWRAKAGSAKGNEPAVHRARRQRSPAAETAECPRFLFNHGRGHAGILFQPFGDGGFEAIEFSFALRLGRSLRRRIEVLLNGPLTQARVALDLADRPVLALGQAMQVACVPGGCCSQDSDCGGMRSGGTSKIQICAGAELLFARSRRRRF